MTTGGGWEGYAAGAIIVGGAYTLFLLIKIFRVVTEMAEWHRVRHEEVMLMLETLVANLKRTSSDELPRS